MIMETVALVVATVWMGLLTLVVLLLVRQVGLIAARLEESGTMFSLADDGLPIGSNVPDEAVLLLPDLAAGVRHLVVMSASCAPCRTLVADLSAHPTSREFIALVPGSKQLAQTMIDSLPPGTISVQDPDAKELSNWLGVRSTPFGLEITDRVVTSKRFLTSATDLEGLMSNRSMDPSANGEKEVGSARTA